MDVRGLCGGGFEKSSGNCPDRGEESCRNGEAFVRVDMTFTWFKVIRDVCFRAISSALFQHRL
jgi:hypothetical protein